jgi:hypothetical protein
MPGSQLRLCWSVAGWLVPGIGSVSLVSAWFGHAEGTGVGPRRPGARRRWVISRLCRGSPGSGRCLKVGRKYQYMGDDHGE